MKLVKFRDGKYGVRRGWLTFKFFDFTGGGCWWPLNKYPEFASSCRVEKQKAKKFIEHATDMGEVGK